MIKLNTDDILINVDDPDRIVLEQDENEIIISDLKIFIKKLELIQSTYL